MRAEGLATAAAKLPVPDKSKLVFKKKSEYRYIGKDVAPVDQHNIVTGKDIEPSKLPVLDACMIVLMDHGITPPAIVARLIADSLPGQAQIGIAAGTMMIGEKSCAVNG